MIGLPPLAGVLILAVGLQAMLLGALLLMRAAHQAARPAGDAGLDVLPESGDAPTGDALFAPNTPVDDALTMRLSTVRPKPEDERAGG